MEIRTLFISYERYKREPINIVDIYPLQVEFQGQKSEKKNHLAKGITMMNKLQ